MADDFTQFAKKNSRSQRRLAIPITKAMEQAIEGFKAAYPDREFSDTAVLKTMIVAGFKVWAKQQNS